MMMLILLMLMLMLMLMPMLRMGDVETYTSLAPVGALTQEYKGLLVVSKVFCQHYHLLISIFDRSYHDI